MFSSILIILASPNIILLLIIWVFHTVHPNHTCFPFLPSRPSHFSVLPLRKIYQVPFVLPGYSLGHDQITSGQPLRENWILSHFPARSHQLWGATSLSQFLRTLFYSFLSGLLLGKIQGRGWLNHSLLLIVGYIIYCWIYKN